MAALPRIATSGNAIRGRWLPSVMATAIDPGPTVIGIVEGIKAVGPDHRAMAGALVVIVSQVCSRFQPVAVTTRPPAIRTIGNVIPKNSST